MGGKQSSNAASTRSRRNSAGSSSTTDSSWEIASEHGSFKSLTGQRDRLDTDLALGGTNLQRSFSFHGSSGLRDKYLLGVKPQLYKHPEDNWEIESLNLMRLSGHQRKTISCLWAAKLSYYFAFGMEPVAIPVFVELYGLKTAAAGTLFATWALATIVFWPIWKAVVTRLGTKNLLLVGMFLTALSFFLFGCLHIEESWRRFLALAYILKAIEGAGFAAIEIAACIKTLTEFPRHESGAYGSVRTCIGVGVTIGAGIGGFLYSLADVASTFLTAGILIFIVALVTLCLMPKRAYIGPTIKDTPKRKKRFFRETDVHSAIIMYFFGIFGVSGLFSILEPHLREVFHFNLTVEGILIALIPLGFVFGVAFWQWLITHDYVCGLACVNVFGLAAFGLSLLFLGPCKVFRIPNDLLWLNVICFLVIGGTVAMTLTSSVNALLETAEIKRLNKLATYETITTVLIITLCVGVAVGSCISGYLNQTYGFEFTTTVFATILFTVAVLDGIYAVIKTAIRVYRYNQIQAEVERQRIDRARQGLISRAPLMGASLAETRRGLHRYNSQISKNAKAINDRHPLLESTRTNGRSYGTYL